MKLLNKVHKIDNLELCKKVKEDCFVFKNETTNSLQFVFIPFSYII